MPTFLSADVIVPEFTFRVSNPREVVVAMGRAQRVRVRSRVLAGQGSRGPLPRSKDGRPYIASGQLLDSIEDELRLPRSPDGLPFVMVLPTGLRREVAEVGKQRKQRSARRRKARRAQLRAMRAAGQLGLGEEGIRARAARAATEARRVGRTNVRVGTFRAIFRRAERAGRYGISDAQIREQASQAGKLGYRQARRNMDVAAILMNKPKDLRARNGNRGEYIVLEATLQDRRALQKIAVKLARFELVEKDSRAVHRGTGVAG